MDDNGGSSESLLEISLLEIVYDVYSIRISNEIIEQSAKNTSYTATSDNRKSSTTLQYRVKLCSAK